MPALTDVNICVNACLRLGSSSFDSFTDADKAHAAIAGEVYPRVKASLLSRHNWHFASAIAQLSREVATPVAKWSYQYLLPGDRVANSPVEIFTTASVGANPYKEWEIIGEKLLSNAATLYCVYTKDVAESAMPPYFVDLLIKAMMVELCMAIKDRPDQRQLYYAEFWSDGGDWQRAKNADARNHPPKVYMDHVLLDAREGGMGTRILS